MSFKKIKIGIVGATGFGGGELLRLLCHHPQADVVYVTASAAAGQMVHEVHPNLRGLYDLTFSAHPEQASDLPLDLDMVFLGVPHGKSMKIAPSLPSNLKVIDLSGDYRLKTPALFKEYYGETHIDPSGLDRAVYGLSELNRDLIREAKFVAKPGCFATAVQMGTFPLVQASLLADAIVCDAKTGSSGSGVSPKVATHHPKRDGSFYAYKLLSHQHEGEILQTLGHTGFSGEFSLQVHSAPFVRGIFASIYTTVNPGTTSEDVAQAFDSAYEGSPFVRRVDGSPDIHWVRQSNFVDIGFALKGNMLATFVAIDNLVKGAAGQAIQNMNLMNSLPEETGLLVPGGYPS